MFSVKSIIFCAAAIFSLTLTAAPEGYVAPPIVTPSAKYTPPKLIDNDSWTMVIVPDTQNYVKNLRTVGITDLMFSWIAENVEHLKIQQVLMTGDLVDANREESLSKDNNQSGLKQWENISTVFKRLDNIVPYILSTGNHDYGIRCSEDRQSYFDRFFTAERNNKLKNVLRACAPNDFGKLTLENAAYEFVTPYGQKILIVSLAYSPLDSQLEWAKKIFDLPQYKEHFGIVLTHSYIHCNYKRKYRSKDPAARLNRNGNAGEDIYNKLVRQTSNIRMVICGHVSKPDDWNISSAFLTSVNGAGKKVYEMLFDPQEIGVGGDGWLRLLEFSKDMKTVKVRTFSPLFALSPSTQHLAWHTAPFNDFTIKIED